MKLLTAFAGTAVSFPFMAGPRASLPRRARWLQYWSRRVLHLLNLSIQVGGSPPPRRGIVVSNHLGYLDILVFSAVNRQVFVSKAEVRHWPLIGWFTLWSGAQFIERGRKGDVARINDANAQTIASDTVVTLFLEGTSTDGREVRPFRASLLEPVAQGGVPVTPAALRFSCRGGNAANDLCWWGDMTFVGHLWRLLQIDAAVAQVSFGETLSGAGDRKQLAVQLREQVVALKAELTRIGPVESAP